MPTLGESAAFTVTVSELLDTNYTALESSDGYAGLVATTDTALLATGNSAPVWIGKSADLVI